MTDDFRTKLEVTCVRCGHMVLVDHDADLHLPTAVLSKADLRSHASEHPGEVTYSAVFNSELHITLSHDREQFKVESPKESAVGKAQMLFRPVRRREET